MRGQALCVCMLNVHVRMHVGVFVGVGVCRPGYYYYNWVVGSMRGRAVKGAAQSLAA